MDGLEQFKTSPRYVYPQSIEQNNPALNPDFVKKLKQGETVGINEEDEDFFQPETQEPIVHRVIGTSELLGTAEYKSHRQSNPCVVITMLFLSMIILAVLTFYAKIMMHYEKQNAFECIYAINLINLILFAIVLKCKGKFNRNKYAGQNLTVTENAEIKAEYNVFHIAKEDRL